MMEWTPHVALIFTFKIKCISKWIEKNHEKISVRPVLSEFIGSGILLCNSALTTVANKKQHSTFASQGEASLHAPNVRKKTWEQEADTPICQLGSSGPVWLIQPGLCAGIRIFQTFVMQDCLSGNLESWSPVLGDSLWNSRIFCSRITVHISQSGSSGRLLGFLQKFSQNSSEYPLFWSVRVNFGWGSAKWVAEEWHEGGFGVFWDQELEPVLSRVKREGDLWVEWL